MYALNSAPSKLQPRPIATPTPMFGVVLSNPVWVGVGVGALHTSVVVPVQVDETKPAVVVVPVQVDETKPAVLLYQYK